MGNKRRSMLFRLLAFLLAVQLALPGCVSYQGKPAPIPAPRVMPFPYSDNSVEIYADPYVRLDRQKEYFDANPSE